MSEESTFPQKEIDAALSHFGIKGQKWGVRRKNPSGESVASASPDGSVPQTKSSKGVTRFKEKPKNLTDAELQARIKRIETEKRYKELNKRHVGAGQKAINEVLATIGKDTAKRAGTGLAFYAVKKALASKTKIDVTEAFPKKK